MSGIRIKNLQSANPIVDDNFDEFQFVVDVPSIDSTLKMSGKELIDAVGGAGKEHTHEIEDINGLQDDLNRKLDGDGGVIDNSLQSSDFIPGLTGRGFQIKKDEHGKWRQEIGSLVLHDFLEVPELRFNRKDVVSGELWNSIAFGTIESVDIVEQIVTVKLLNGELLSSHVGDINQGTFHNPLGTLEGEDSNGFLRMKGFATSYFTPTELLPDGKSFRYELQSGTTFHPCKAMKFVCYGSFNDKTRQASAYSTRTYTRYLSGVNTWAINPDRHIVAQFGDIDGLTIGGVTMKGTGSFQKNMYMTGVHIQFTPEQKEEMKGNDAYNVSLNSSHGMIKVNVDGTLPPMIIEKSVVTGDRTVTANGKNVVTNEFKLSSRIQAFKGSQELYYSTISAPGSYTITITPFGCDAVVMGGVLSITSIADRLNAFVDLSIVCEGEAVFNKRYSVMCISDGANGENVATGAMPRNLGEYSSSQEYIYDKNFRDCCFIKENGVITVYQVASFGTLLVNNPPGNSNKNWMIGNKETFTAIDTALIDGADIAGFLLKDGVMQSRDQTNGVVNTTINGKTGEIITRKLTAINANITGTINATGGKIGDWKIVGSKLETSIPLIGGEIISSLGIGKMRIQEPFGYVYFNKNETSGIYVNIEESSDYPNVGFSKYSAVKISGYNTLEGGNALELYSKYGLALKIINGGIKISAESIPLRTSRYNQVGWDYLTGELIRFE